MAMEIKVPVDEEGFKRAKENNSKMGYVAWNIAIMNAPYDTGNLRNAIRLGSNTSRLTTIKYNLMLANYIKFLELGQGRVKKHKGFIRDKTLLDVAIAYIGYIENGTIPEFSYTPVISLNSTSQIFNTEKKVLRSLGIKTSRITSNVRGQISRIRETEYRKNLGIEVGNISGKKADTEIGLPKNQWSRYNRGTGKLNNYRKTL